MATPVREVYAMLGGDNGLEGRATSCARGSAMLEHQTSPYRVRTPLKRVGPRGSGQWQSISFEQLIQEVCHGGDLFGKGGMATRDGEPVDLECAEDFYVRGISNIAYQAGRPVPEASDDDIEITGLSRWMPEVHKRLKDEEVRRVAMVMSRGGRFDTVDESWKDDHIKAAYKFPVQIWHEGLAKMRHSMTGERYAGCPTWFPTRFADGSSMREHYPESEWPLTMSSYKSNLMSSMSIGVKRLRQVHPHNPISLHKEDAARFGIANGDAIEVSTPGAKVQGVALVRSGVARGTVAIEYGYGHRQLGAVAHLIDGKPTAHNPQHGQGVNLNALGFTDPTRPEQDNVWIDWVSGAVVRQGLPVRVRKLA